MPRGGHGRTGPAPKPGSARSEQRGFKLTALPSEGFKGEAPDLSAFLVKPSARHQQVWTQLWTTPQACAWSLEPWCWPVVADLVKWQVRSDLPDAPVSLAQAVRQLRDDCGLSKAGMARLGWAIATDELAAKALASVEASAPAQRRLRAADAK